MLHPEIMAHLMSNGGGDQTDDIRVIHGDATGELVRTYRPLKCLPDHAALKSDSAVCSKNKY